MFRTVIIVALTGFLAAPALAGQNAPAEQKPAASGARPAPPEPPLPTANIRIEVSITDQTGSGTPAKKVVSMIAGDRQTTNIRSSASVPVKNIGGAFNYRNVTINVDARPTIMPKETNRVIVNLGLEYLPRSAGGQEEMEAGMASFSERLNGVILESGKPMVISQAADPTSDRKVTVEVTATILR